MNAHRCLANLLLCLLMFSFTSPLSAQTNQVRLTLKGSWPGYLRGWGHDVKVVNQRAYVALNSGLLILDVSNPINPVPLGSFPGKGSESVDVSGNYAYLADGPAGLKIIDVSNPASPRLVSTTTGGDARFVHVSGHHAYLGCYPDPYGLNGGLRILDVSNPANPTLVSLWRTNQNAVYYRVQVVGGHAFVSGNPRYIGSNWVGGLEIYDVINPAQPALLWTSTNTVPQFFATVVGQRAYIWNDIGFEIFDVSDPVDPVRLGGYVGARGRLRVDGDLVYASGASALEVIDVSDPSAPQQVGSVADGRGLFSLDVSAGYAFGTRQVGQFGAGELRIFDVRDPASPTNVANFNTAGFAADVFVSGDRAYLADWSGGLQIFSISNPASPTRIGNDAGYLAGAVQVAGNYAYVSADSQGLLALDVNNPASPVRTSQATFGVGGQSADVHVSGNHAYVTVADGSEGGLHIFSLANPAVPSGVGSYITGYETFGVYASGGVACVMDEDNGLSIFDVSNPANPQLLDRGATYGFGVHIAGSLAYVAGSGLGFKVVDLNGALGGDDNAEVVIGSHATRPIAWSVELAGRYAYVGGEGLWYDPEYVGGIEVFDVLDPAHPVRVGGVDTGGFVRGIQIAGNYLYVANGYAGLSVYEITLPPSITSITRTGNQLVLAWSGAPGRKLQRTGSLTNPNWTDVPGSDGQSQVELPLGTGPEFFRLINP